MQPLISIVIPSFNQGKYIEQTIASIVNQSYKKVEIIIIDAASTDETVAVIEKYEQYISYWVSEPDRGQSHAINKGLEKCTGEIFNWINSDDYLEPGALHKIAQAFSDEKVQMVAGKVRNFSLNDEEIISNQNLSAEGIMCWQPGVQFVQPGVWMRRMLIDECGRSEERRVGKECQSTCRSRWSPYH